MYQPVGCIAVADFDVSLCILLLAAVLYISICWFVTFSVFFTIVLYIMGTDCGKSWNLILEDFQNCKGSPGEQNCFCHGPIMLFRVCVSIFP